MARLPYYTTLPGARAVVQALARVRTGELEVAPLQSYFADLALIAPPPALLGAISSFQPLIGSRRVMTTKIPMTPDGHARLSAELRRLKTEERPAVIKAIAAAREHGDLSENAEYHAARERQGFIEGRVMELEDKLSRAEVIDIRMLSGSKIMFGARVKLVDEDTDEEASYQVVGPRRGRHPVGPALDPVAPGAGHSRQGGGRKRRGDHAARRALFRDHRGRLQLSRTPPKSRRPAAPR